MDGKKINIKQFPDVDKKLQAASKKGLFEKQKAEAEAKRLREEAETAAVYQDFVKSFDDEEEGPNDVPVGGYGGGYGGGGYRQRSSPPKPQMQYGAAPSGPGRGGFSMAPPRSGPGSLGPAPQSMGRSGPGSLGPPPPSRGFNRGLNAFDQPPPPRGPPSALHQPPPPRGPAAAFERYEQPPPPSRNREYNDRRPYDDIYREVPPRSKVPAAFSTSDDEDDVSQSAPRRPVEPPVPKPTIQMSNLPPGTSPAAIKALLPSSLTVDAVRIIPPTGPASATERKSMSAIVTLSKETAASDIDAAVSQLRDHYLGYGFYLSLSRHLSTAALSSAPTPALSGGHTTTQPFGAKQAALEQPEQKNMHAPPGSYRGIAPPASYSNVPSRPTGPVFHVLVLPPADIRELRLIHRTLENLLTHGPEFEALLMSRLDVQREEKWAWVWDARSVGGIWYRWRLWELLTGAENKPGRHLPVFEDMPAWKAPENTLAFEYVTRLEEFVEEDDYNSSEDDESDEEEQRGRDRRGNEMGPKEDTETFLNPMQKAHLAHLLVRLPSNVQKLRRGDVARVTAFALKNAKKGAMEVVDMVVANVLHPYSSTSANPDYAPPSRSSSSEKSEKIEDTSAASLVGLRLIPDIIAAALNSGVSSARVYRQLFEKTIEQKRVFERLGKLDRKMKWGRMSTEKWKGSVRGEVGRWKDSCLFMPGAPEGWLETFCNPKVSKEEEEREREREEEEERRKKESRWKAVKKGEATKQREIEMQDAAPTIEEDEGVDGAPMEEDDEDVDGEPMVEDGDVDGEPMLRDDEEVDGEPMAMDKDEPKTTSPAPAPTSEAVTETEGGPEETKRKRPRAEDMFADSGSEGEGR